MGELKTHIETKLKIHNITSIEKSRHKVKVVEAKIEISFQTKFNNVYLRINVPHSTNTRNTKYKPPHLQEDNKSSLES